MNTRWYIPAGRAQWYADYSGTQSTVVNCVIQSLFNDWFMASRTIPLHSNAWAVLMLFCWHVHSCQSFCNDALYQCLYLHTWLQPCVTFRIMPEALPVLFVMKIAKNQVDTPITILTCMHLILVTRGISGHKRHHLFYVAKRRTTVSVAFKSKWKINCITRRFKDLQNAYCNDVICARCVYKDVSLV